MQRPFVTNLPALVVQLVVSVLRYFRFFTNSLLMILLVDPESRRIFIGCWLSVGRRPGLVKTIPSVTADSSFCLLGFLLLGGFLRDDKV